MSFVTEALELEDTIKNYDHRHSTRWKYISSLRLERIGRLGSFLDIMELLWRCILSRPLEKRLAIILGCISAAILLAEATILLSGVDGSLFSIVLNAVKCHEVFVQRMGNIDDAVPFFGRGFNKIYPLIMVIYTLLIASNFFDRVLEYFGNWKIFKLQSEDDLDGFDPSGMIILQRECSWIKQGLKVGELIIPLARNFNNISMDFESGNNNVVSVKVKTKVITSAIEGGKRGFSKFLRLDVQHDTETGGEGINTKYIAVRNQ